MFAFCGCGGLEMPRLGEVFTGRVRDVSSAGAGIVEHPGGRVFFVSGVWVGEEARFRITGFRNRFGYARLEELLTPAQERVTPRCAHHGSGSSDCGGCPWQFVDYGAQLAAKENRLKAALSPLGLADKPLPIWPSPRPYGYRNRAQLKTDGERIGYVAAGSRRIAPVEDCPILTDRNRTHLRELLEQLPNSRWRPRKRGRWTTLDMDEEGVSIDRRRPFRQGNSDQNLRMRDWLKARLAPLDRRLPVLELFAGSGNFTEVIADTGFEHIVAVEGVGEAIDRLRARGLPGVETWRQDLFADGAWRRLGRNLEEVGILVADPPRRGIENARGLATAARKCRNLVYVSCDPATFARDLGVFLEAGYSALEIQPLDQFPHTPHVEMLAHLQRDV